MRHWRKVSIVAGICLAGVLLSGLVCNSNLVQKILARKRFESQLEGKWKVTSWKRAGKMEEPPVGREVSIKNGKIVLEPKDKEPKLTVNFELANEGDTKNGWAVDFSKEGDKTEFGLVGLSNDEMKVVVWVSRNRPPTLDTTEHHAINVVLSRAK